MSIFTCWSVGNVLDLFIDHRLTRDADHWVAEHIQDCDACREKAENLAPIEGLKEAAGRAALPEGLKASILEAYEEGEAAGGWSPRLQPAQGLALLYCLALAGIHGLDRPGSQAGAPAASERTR